MTIVTQPGEESSVNNEMLFVISDPKTADPVTYPDYRFVLDVYINDEFVQRQKSRPNPSNNMGVFDVSAVLQQAVEYGLKAEYTNAFESYEAGVSYKIKLGEEYGDTLYTNLVVDSTDRIAKKSYGVRPFITSEIMQEVDDNFATNQTGARTAYKSSKWDLVPFYANTSGVTDFDIQLFNSAGVQQGTTVSISTPANPEEYIYQINAGFQKIASALTAQQQEDAAYATITYPATGQVFRLNYVCEGKYTPLIIAWLNQYGAYESQAFGLVSKKTIETAKKEYGRLAYEINASGDVNYASNGVYYGSKRTYSAIVTVRMKLTSHLLTEAEYSWLSELFASTDVYMYDPHNTGGKWFPVKVQEQQYEYRNYKNSKLVPLEFNIEFSDTYNAQFL